MIIDENNYFRMIQKLKEIYIIAGIRKVEIPQKKRKFYTCNLYRFKLSHKITSYIQHECFRCSSKDNWYDFQFNQGIGKYVSLLLFTCYFTIIPQTFKFFWPTFIETFNRKFIAIQPRCSTCFKLVFSISSFWGPIT